MEKSSVLEILLVEDDKAQVYLVQRALALWTTPYNLHVASTAAEALDHINRRNGYRSAPRPHLTLLDLNLPKEPGFVVLEAIKTDPRLWNIVVIVLSSSVAQSDIQRAMASHANAYLQKPGDLQELGRLFDALEAFWRSDARFQLGRRL